MFRWMKRKAVSPPSVTAALEYYITYPDILAKYTVGENSTECRVQLHVAYNEGLMSPEDYAVFAECYFTPNYDIIYWCRRLAKLKTMIPE